ncbi:MAG TPA: DUF1360 domain-containing protein [Pseudolabrys sp.]|nr:DUF1360 domain-containing protein [Pseudolabrys sp.]
MSGETIGREQRFWNTVALAAFVALCAGAVVLIYNYGALDPAQLGFLDLVLAGLATFRLIHLITYDKIFGMVRAAFMDRDGARLTAAEGGWRRAAYELMNCLWCTGMWSALVVVTVYLLGVWGRFAVMVLAVAGLGSLLQILSKALARQD